MFAKRFTAFLMACIMVISIVMPMQNVYATASASQRELVTVRTGEIFEIRNLDAVRQHSIILSGSNNVYFDFLVYNHYGLSAGPGQTRRGATVNQIYINGVRCSMPPITNRNIPRGGVMLIEVRGNGHVIVSGDPANFEIRQLITPIFYTRMLNQGGTVSFTHQQNTLRNLRSTMMVHWQAPGHPFSSHRFVERPRNATVPAFRMQEESISPSGESRRLGNVSTAISGVGFSTGYTRVFRNTENFSRPAWSIQAFELFGCYTSFSGQPYRITIDGERSFPPGLWQDLPPLENRGIPPEYYVLYRMLNTSQIAEHPSFELLFGRYTTFTTVYMDNVGRGDVYLLGLTSDVRNALVRGLFTGNLDATTNAIMNNPQRVQAIVRDLVNNMSGNTIYTANKDVDATFDILSSLASVLERDQGFSDVRAIRYLLTTLRYSDGGFEVLSRTAQDYSQNIAILESIRGLNSTPVFRNTIDALILEYQRSVGESLLTCGRYLIEGKLVSEVIVLLAGKPVVALISVLDGVVGNAPRVTGLETIIVTDNFNLATINAFRNSARTIASGNFTSADVQSYRNAFYMARNLQIMRYEAKRAQFPINSSEMNYINAQLGRLRQMRHDRFVYSVPFA